jgi:YidC/Oxa1 family membrane protein insertase
MTLWTEAVDVLREAMFLYAQATSGNLAHGILAITFLVRLILLPLTVRLAATGAHHQGILRKLKPELDRVRETWKADPRRMAEETQRVLTREGVSMVPTAGCLGMLAQAPVFLALFDAVRQVAAVGGRFAWVRDIAKPDAALSVVVAALTAASVAAGPQVDAAWSQRLLLVALPAVVTLVALWHMAAGVGLYWGASSVVGIAQGLLVRRALARRTV